MKEFLSDKAMEALNKYRALFEMFERSKYVRYPGRAALTEIHTIYTLDTGNTSLRLNTNCQRCMTELFAAVTPIYLHTLRNAPQSTDAAGVEETSAPKKKPAQKRKPRKITE
jgi:hypothetical protein